MSMLKRKPRVEPDGLKSAVVQEANRHLERAHAENSSLQERLDRAVNEVGRLRILVASAEDVSEGIGHVMENVPGMSWAEREPGRPDQVADVRELAGKYLKLLDEYVTLRGAEPDGSPAAAVAVLERLARPGTINPTERRKLAGEALEALGVTGDAEAAQ